MSHKCDILSVKECAGNCLCACIIVYMYMHMQYNNYLLCALYMYII